MCDSEDKVAALLAGDSSGSEVTRSTQVFTPSEKTLADRLVGSSGAKIDTVENTVDRTAAATPGKTCRCGGQCKKKITAEEATEALAVLTDVRGDVNWQGEN